MEYISVKAAAEKWGISQRYVQRYCTDGRILGAVKFSGSWAIPADAPRPGDLRKLTNHVSLTKPHMPMPLLNTPFSLGLGLKAAKAVEDPDERAIALAEFYYFSGQAEKAVLTAEPYLEHPDLALRLSACWLCAYAGLSLNRIPLTRHAMGTLKRTVESVDEYTPPQHQALAECISTTASVLLHLPLPKILSPLKQYIHMMPPGMRLFVLYVEAHHSYLQGQYGAAIGIAETALALEGELYPIPSIYLHLVATMGYINLRHTDAARDHLLKAWSIARADDLIQPFGEHHGLLGGMLEAVMKKEWPEDFNRVIGITYRFSSGWRKIHNPETGHNVADDLTTTEFTVAMLAAREWSNKEISAHLGISTNTVKLHVSSALQKLGISRRKELAQFMLK